MQTIQARWFSPAGNDRPRQIIVLHDMESPETASTAEDVALYFTRLPGTNKASAHVTVDRDSEVRCVADKDIAYGAPGANAIGLHIEMPGYARNTAEDWLRPESMAMLKRAAAIVSAWCDQYGIPKKFIDAKALSKYAAGATRKPKDCGITTHYEVSKAWQQTNHTDPGPGFPIDWFIDAVNGVVTTLDNEMNTEGDDMPSYIETICPTGGFWLTRKSDGGVYAYNNEGESSGPGVAPFFGSMAGRQMNGPVVDMKPYVVNGGVAGYWLLGADGGVFNFGAAPFTDTYAAHKEWQKGDREIVGIEQHDPGYDIIAVETGSNPPKIDRYDLSEKRK